MTFLVLVMRISSVNQNFGKYIAKPVAKPENSLAQANDRRLSYDKIPSIAFSGANFNILNKFPLSDFSGANFNILNKISLPSGFKNFDGELYKIKLFDKLESKKINAFLGYSEPQATWGCTKTVRHICVYLMKLGMK